MMRWHVWAREATGEPGTDAFTSEPARIGVDLRHRSSTPWLFGTSGSSIALSA